MTTLTKSPRIFVFNVPEPGQLMEDSEKYYRECRIAGAGAVEIELHDQTRVIISATRYLPADVTVEAATVGGALQVICTRGDGRQVVMREFTDWTAYTVHRARP